MPAILVFSHGGSFPSLFFLRTRTTAHAHTHDADKIKHGKISDGSKGAAYVGFSSAGALDEHDEVDDGRADDDKGNGKAEEEAVKDGVAGVEASLTKWSSVASLALAWLCSSSLSCSLVVATDLRPKWPPH